MDVCSAVCKFFLERERNKERASAAVLDAQSSTTNLRMESPTEMPSPTASEKNEVWDWEIVQSPDEAWPRPAEARAAQAARAAAAASVLRGEFPFLERTTHDLYTKHASDLMAAIENKLAEIGIKNFWNTRGAPRLGNPSGKTQWQYMMNLPALARCCCLEAMQARLEAILQNKVSDSAAQESANTFRLAAEMLSEEMQVLTWRRATSCLFAVADPQTHALCLAGDGHQAFLQLPNEVTQRIQELRLDEWPAWYEEQFHAGQHETWLMDENNPAQRPRRPKKTTGETSQKAWRFGTNPHGARPTAG